jgi:hypothetical protein
MQPTAQPASDPATSWALGASLALLAAALTGLLLGWLSGVRGVHGVYITFAMPVLIGSLIGMAAAIPARRLRFGERRPLVAAALLGAIICALGHHAFAFLSFAEAFARANAGDVMPDGVGDAVGAALVYFERATGETGWFAYLAFTAKLPAAQWSPVGLLGQLELGVGGTLATAAGELALLIGASVASVLLRTRALRAELAASPTPFALCDDGQLVAFGAALDRGDLAAAATAIAAPTAAPTYALCWASGGGVSVHALGGPLQRPEPSPKAHRALTAEAARALEARLTTTGDAARTSEESDHADP